MKASPSLVGLLVFTLFHPFAVPAENPTRAPAGLRKFMKKWETVWIGKVPVSEADRPLLLAALAQEPTGPWLLYLLSAVNQEIGSLKSPYQDEASHERILNSSVKSLKETDAALARAIAADSSKGERTIVVKFADLNGKPQTNGYMTLQQGQTEVQMLLAPLLFASKPPAVVEARRMAQAWLDKAGPVNSSSAATVVREANAILGRVALRQENPAEARTHLLAAGRTARSTTLWSFQRNADLILARELLEHGRSEDREAVLTFLTEVQQPSHELASTNKVWQQSAERERPSVVKEIERWQAEIRQGKIPNDSKWR